MVLSLDTPLGWSPLAIHRREHEPAATHACNIWMQARLCKKEGQTGKLVLAGDTRRG
jgi:hypothetical protein